MRQVVADMTGILPSNLARFESGTRVPTLVVLEKHAATLEKHIDVSFQRFFYLEQNWVN